MPLRPTPLLPPLPLVAALALGACTAQVSHPTKSIAEQQVDIDQCTRDANHKYWMDPIAALLHAYDCLEAKGYKRTNKAVAAKVQQTVGPSAPRPPRPESASPAASKPGAVEPCHVPCGAPKG